MGLLRGLARWLVRTLLVLSIAFFLIASTGAYISEKENLKAIVGEVAVQQVTSQQISEIYNDLNQQCQQKGAEILDVSFQNSTIKINCTRIRERKEAEVGDIFKEQMGKMLENLTPGQCSGLDCLSQGPAGLISESFHSFLAKLEIYSVMALVIFGVLVFLLSTGISGRMFALGFPFLIAGVPYFFTNTLKQETLSLIPSQAAAGGATVADAILKSLADKFFLMFLIGFVLVVAGIITRFIFRKK